MAENFPPSPPQRRRLALVAAVCLAVLLPLAGTAAYASHHGHRHGLHKLHVRQHHVHHSVKHVRGDLDEASAALRHARARLQAAGRHLVVARKAFHRTRVHLHGARARYRVVEARLQRAQAAFNLASAAVDRARAAVHDQRQLIGRLALANFQGGDPQLLALSAMLNSGDPGEVTTQLNAINGMMTRQSNTLGDLRTKQAQLKTEELRLAQAKAVVARQRQVAATNLAAKRRLEESAKAQRLRLAHLYASRNDIKRHAAHVRRHDARELRRLQRQERRIERRILARSHHERNRYVGNTGGMLYRPVPGYITSPYGWRMHPIYHYWGLHDGDDFHAPCGTPERAAGSGRVASEYYSSVWGNRLFLDLGRINGHSFTVIYNHIERYRVHTGARVGRGEVLAYAGTTGWSTGCHLHFTVMRDGVAVDPQNYM